MAVEYDWVCKSWSERSCPVDEPCELYEEEEIPKDCIHFPKFSAVFVIKGGRSDIWENKK